MSSTHSKKEVDLVISDEPSRVAMITGALFGRQSGNWQRQISDDENTANISLVLGADACDDSAVYRIRGNVDMVVGSDYVRGVKFTMYELGLLSLYDLGVYLVAANLSDIAAMGATPAAFLSVVRYPREMPDHEFLELMAGIKDECSALGALNVGGDIGSAERLILSGSAVGFCPPNRCLTRTGASAGDDVYLSGRTGIAGAAMHFFARRNERGWHLDDEIETQLLESWKRPRAAVQLGIALSETHGVTSCADTSDGLRATVDHIATASNVAIEIDELPELVDTSVSSVAVLAGKDPLEFVFGDSVDFRLLFTGPSDLQSSLGDYGVMRIGRVVEGENASWLRTADGIKKPLPGVAWRHQVIPPTL